MEDKTQWISVKDRLQNLNVDVLVCGKSGWMQVMYLEDNGYWYPGGCPIGNTSHWTPLPNKPN